MPIPLIVNSTTYNYPVTGDNPTWGDDATAWAQAVTAVLTSLNGPGDVLTTSAIVANNQSSVTNVVGLVFDPTVVRGVIIEYNVYRVTTGIGATEAVETGTIHAGYKSLAASWEFSQAGMGGAGIVFSILSTGQFQYTTTNFSGSSYSGVIKFRARALPV
jgi:hypothetical protein